MPDRCFLSFAAFLFLLAQELPAQDARPLRTVIDAEIQSVWQREKITPSPIADDATFLRRVYLDLVGTVPTAEEARKFLDDPDAKKREKLIDKLLEDPRFASHQADVWDLTLFGRHPANDYATRKRDGFKKWLNEQWTKNVPYDRWVRDLLLAEQEGTELFFIQFRNQPEDAAVAVSKLFLGTQLQCARCHDHPYETWTQKDFYGMAGFFVRLTVLDPSGSTKKYKLVEKSSGDVLFSGAAKDQKPGRKGDPVKPRFLNGAPLEEPTLPMGFKEPDPKTAAKPLFSRKEKFASWLTQPDNPWFAKAVANRVWGQFLGRGLVHPVDDLSEKNSPSHPALLDALAGHLKKNKLDLKGYIRELVNSSTYQRASAGQGTAALPKWFERGRVRPLSAEELQATLRVATARKDKAEGVTSEYFLIYFGEPTNGQGEFQGSLTEHLFLNHSGEILQFISRRPGNLADQLITSKDPWEKKVEHLFLSILNRLPKESEKKRLVEYLTSNTKSADSLVQEAIWALVNTAEFRFNH